LAEYLTTFIFFFAVIDPIGTVPVFIAVTKDRSKTEKQKIALQACLVAAGILIFFVLIGEHLLRAIDISLSSFQIAGGIVLFLFALTMIFGDSKPDEEIKMTRSNTDVAIFPLAIPSIASPGAMLAAVLLTENNKYNVIEQLQTTSIMLSVLTLTLALLMASTFIHRFLGNSGASIISRVMGLILSSVAIENVLSGVKDYFAL